MRVSFLIPSYNDATTITRVVAEACAVGEKVASTFEVIIVNDGSRDATWKILKELVSKSRYVKLINHQHNQGYGKTIKELYYRGRYEWLFSIPGDHQVGAKELFKLIPYTKNADMVIGWRKNRQDPPSRLIQSWLYNNLLNSLFGPHLHDVNSVRLMRRSILKKLRLASSSAFVDAELALKSKAAGCRLVEVPIEHRKRFGKRRGGGGNWQTILGTFWEMVRFRCR